jgi:exopolysaccharide biosynthesis polyprenyl glycosylphosphotransferase
VVPVEAIAVVVSDCVGLLGAILLVGDLRFTALVPSAFAVMLLAAGGLYGTRIDLSVLDDLPGITGRLLVAAALGATYRELASHGVAFGPRLLLVVVSAALVLGGRAAVYEALRRVRRRAPACRRTLVVGAGRIGQDVVRLIGENPACGLEPVGFYDPDPLPLLRRTLPVFGDDDLSATISQHNVSLVIVAFGSVNEHLMVDVLRACYKLDCEMYAVPRLFELSSPVSRNVDRIGSIPLVRLNRTPYRSTGWQAKRLVDIVVSALALTMLSPVMAAIALLVRLDSGPGVLFRQERVGVDHRRFTLYKFRSLRPSTASEAETTWNIKVDQRLSPLGRILRSTSLDELPQLWNVLKGDMSLVGPRPERPHFVGQFSEAVPRYPARHRVPSGLTGWAQVHGLRGDTSIEDRARFDNNYIESWTLWNDMKILLRTITSVIGRRGG